MAEPLPVPFADECHEEVNRRGQLQPCDRPAVALRLDPHELTPYPVCAPHCRAPMVALRDLMGMVSMAEQRVTDEELRLWRQRAECGLLASNAVTLTLIADLRAPRAREARLQENWEFQHGVARSWLANWKAAQRRIDKALVVCDTRWRWCFKRQVVDPALVRAALTGTEPDRA